MKTTTQTKGSSNRDSSNTAQTAVVTGATPGLGRAAAQALAQRGFRVLLSTLERMAS